MKSNFSTATLLAAIWSVHYAGALAQQTPGAVPAAPEGGAAAGVFDIPRVDAQNTAVPSEYSWIPMMGRTAANQSPFSVSSGSGAIIQFSQPDPRGVDELQEDLNVMSLLLQKKLEEAVGENSLTYRMGIPMLLRSGQRSIESLYLDGFGALFSVNVNFPLLPPAAAKPKETDATTGSDDWDKARRELYGVRETDAANPYASAAVPYDAGKVAALKQALLEVLKNGAHIRRLKPEESVVVTVFGTESVPVARGMPGGAGGFGGGFGGGSGVALIPDNKVLEHAAVMEAYQRRFRSEAPPGSDRATVLTVRVRKLDAHAFAKGTMNFDEFQQKASINAYLGAAGSGVGWKGGAYSVVAPVPVAR